MVQEHVQIFTVYEIQRLDDGHFGYHISISDLAATHQHGLHLQA